MNNEAILNKLIELGVVIQNGGHYKHADGSFISMKRFDPIAKAHDAELIKQALFDECGKRGLLIVINHNLLSISKPLGLVEWNENIFIHKGDLSRASFLAAFCKVVGVSCE